MPTIQLDHKYNGGLIKVRQGDSILARTTLYTGYRFPWVVDLSNLGQQIVRFVGSKTSHLPLPRYSYVVHKNTLLKKRMVILPPGTPRAERIYIFHCISEGDTIIQFLKGDRSTNTDRTTNGKGETVLKVRVSVGKERKGIFRGDIII